MKVGDIVFIGVKDKPQIQEDKILKIGRLYIELENNKNKFKIDGLWEQNKYGYARKLYSTRQEIEDRQERHNTINSIKKQFASYGKLPFTLDQLRRINNILNEHP